MLVEPLTDSNYENMFFNFAIESGITPRYPSGFWDTSKCHDRTSVLSFFHFWAVKVENYGSVFDLKERFFRVARFLAKSAPDSVWAVFGQCATPHLLLLFGGGFGNSFRVVFGQFSLNFG